MNLIEEAMMFAIHAHEGQRRKMSDIPYILHPVEVANIIATMTTDPEVIAAGILHDTIEDCGVLAEEIRDKFGPRVAALVQSESEDKLGDRPEEETWMQRKEDSLLMLKYTPNVDTKIMWLADKLSNLRSFHRAYVEQGYSFLDCLHQKDPAMQAWYYESVAEYVKEELGNTVAYQEYVALIPLTFGEAKKPND